MVHCVCFHQLDSIENLTSEFLDKNYGVNVRATALLCKEFLLNYSGKGGRIVLLSSMQDKEHLISEIAYAITKASIPVLTKTLSPLLTSKGITINAINPGTTDIGLTDTHNEHYLSNDPCRRLGTPTDSANVVSFLVSEAGKWIRGQTIDSDGGLG